MSPGPHLNGRTEAGHLSLNFYCPILTSGRMKQVPAEGTNRSALGRFCMSYYLGLSRYLYRTAFISSKIFLDIHFLHSYW
jgi:hypothetical protein